MAAYKAELRIQVRRVEHIQQLMAEIAERQHIAAQLLAGTVRACYYFLTLACLTAGVVGLAEGRDYLAATWGAAGICLLLVWIGAKATERVAGRAARELREELAKLRPGMAADAAPGTEPPARGGSGRTAGRR